MHLFISCREDAFLFVKKIFFPLFLLFMSEKVNAITVYLGGCSVQSTIDEKAGGIWFLSCP